MTDRRLVGEGNEDTSIAGNVDRSTNGQRDVARPVRPIARVTDPLYEIVLVHEPFGKTGPSPTTDIAEVGK